MVLTIINEYLFRAFYNILQHSTALISGNFLFILSSGLYDEKYGGDQKGGGVKGENKLSDKCLALISAMQDAQSCSYVNFDNVSTTIIIHTVCGIPLRRHIYIPKVHVVL